MPLSTESKLLDWFRFVDLLGRTDEPQAVIQAVIDEGIKAIGADGGFVSLVSEAGDALNFIGSYAYRQEALDFLKSVPLSAQLPFVMAYNRREALFLESLEQARTDYPEVAPYIQNLHGSVADLPLLVGDEALGVLALSFRQARTFSPYERTFLRVLAAQCAQALHRSQALHDERRARAQAEALQERFAYLSAASQALNISLDLTATLETLTRLAVPRLADWCSVSLPQGDHLIPVAVAHEDPAKVELVRRFTEHYPVLIEGSGAGQVFRTGEPRLTPVITEEMLRASSSDEVYLEAVRALELHSMVQVPLTVHGRTVGVMGLASSRPERTYQEQDLPFLLEVSNRAALAVENAGLYAQLQQELEQRTRAQEAVATLNTQLEARVRERTQALEEANANLEAFTYTASHDLRAPVRHIYSFAELLQRRLGTEDTRAQLLLTQIRNAAHRMDELTLGLLDLARVSSQTLAFGPVDLGALVHQVIDDLAPDLTGRQVHWEVGRLPVVCGDPRLLRQVFQNLLGNAVKYTRPRGEARVTICARTVKQELWVEISDNGVGFEPERAGQLFGLFQRLHHQTEFEGTGVGLATVQRIMTRHGGRVWADSTPGQGATFTLSFPPQPEEGPGSPGHADGHLRPS
ncbi:ATP-binding protein [Deinococcus navajonensis]|uniref:histidine kinase n=1 Tax=Deinococcus navajonensis TaxID=309884 RepID=A0ABV8XNT3_9DEIO